MMASESGTKGCVIGAILGLVTTCVGLVVFFTSTEPRDKFTYFYITLLAIFAMVGLCSTCGSFVEATCLNNHNTSTTQLTAIIILPRPIRPIHIEERTVTKSVNSKG